MIDLIIFSSFTLFESESKECEKLTLSATDLVQNDGNNFRGFKLRGNSSQ